MIEAYSLPSCVPITATYTQYTNGVAASSVTLNNVIFYEKNGMLENNALGVTYNVNIAVSVLATKPGLQDYITISGVKFKFISPKLKNQSPLIRPFWQSEVKSVK